MEKKKPIFVIRPRFDSAMTIIESVFAGIGGMVVSTFLFATFLYIVLNIIGLSGFVSAGMLYKIFFVLGLFGAPALYYEMKRAAYRRTAYLFYDDMLEYQEYKFLITRVRNKIRLADITDVYERPSALQTRRALTCIHLAVPRMPTRSHGISADSIFAGIRIPDVPERAGYTDAIIDLIQNGPPARRQTAETTGVEEDLPPLPLLPPEGSMGPPPPPADLLSPAPSTEADDDAFTPPRNT